MGVATQKLAGLKEWIFGPLRLDFVERGKGLEEM